MKVTVISDIHGNLPALEKVFQLEGDTDLYICLGDVVNYGPWNNECVDFINNLDNCICILGDHETYFLKGNYPNQNELVQKFFDVTFKTFNRFNLISSYKEKWKNWDWVFKHTIDDKYIFPDTNIEVHENIFIGHSHKQFIKSINGKIVCNPGSVGQNRSIINLINYAVFYTEFNSIELKKIPYNVEIVLNEMKVRGYPKECLAYYSKKNRI